ncbi:hypothetical protein HYV86_01855 [Candidatus Woesearchaeota archaeon]|nr:hypothetical protein [Candidatus Woesearchaeota archaeon]
MSLSLVRSVKNAVQKTQQVHALNATEILEALVRVADTVDKRFTPTRLDDWWKVIDEVEYGPFIHDIGVEQGHNYQDPEIHHRPLWGYNKQHHYFRKRDIDRLRPFLTIVDEEKFGALDINAELLIMTFHINYDLTMSNYYFDRSFLPQALENYVGLGKAFAKRAAPIWETILRARGYREKGETEAEIIRILAASRVSDKDRPVRLIHDATPADLFRYQNRFIGLLHDTNAPDALRANLVDLIWGLGVYTTWPHPLGYVQFNNEQKIKSLLE